MYPLFWKIHFTFQYFILTRKIFEGLKKRLVNICVCSHCVLICISQINVAVLC